MSERTLLKVRTPSGISELQVDELIEINGRVYIESESMPADVSRLTDRVVLIEATLAALLEPVHEITET